LARGRFKSGQCVEVPRVFCLTQPGTEAVYSRSTCKLEP